MTDNSALDSILEDALQEYENVDSAAPTSAPSQEGAEKPKNQSGEKLFPPSADEMAATFQALMGQFGAPGGDAAGKPSSSSADAPISDAAAEAQADDALKEYLSAISAGAPSGDGSGSGALDEGFGENELGALIGLLKPFISKELLYGPFSQMRLLYPEWLEKNKETLSPKEYEQRKEQYEIICKVCKLYEDQKTPDDHLQEIMILVEKMGQAPQDLIDEASKSCDGQMPDLSMFGGAGAGAGDDDDDAPDSMGAGNPAEPECIIM